MVMHTNRIENCPSKPVEEEDKNGVHAHELERSKKQSEMATERCDVLVWTLVSDIY